MSRKADCWDNAPTESLWGSLKRARLHGRRFETRQAAQWEVMDWLAFYNATRLHSTLGYVSPLQHERNWLAAQERSPLNGLGLRKVSRGPASKSQPRRLSTSACR